MSDRTNKQRQNGTAAPTSMRSMDDILADLERAQSQPATEEVPIPEWNAVFRVRGLTRAQVLDVARRTIDQRTGRIANLDLNDELQLTYGIVEPKFTSVHYKQVRHRVDATVIIGRLLAAIGTLTNGAPAQTPDGEEVQGLDAAYFPVDGEGATTGA